MKSAESPENLNHSLKRQGDLASPGATDIAVPLPGPCHINLMYSVHHNMVSAAAGQRVDPRSFLQERKGDNSHN